MAPQPFVLISWIKWGWKDVLVVERKQWITGAGSGGDGRCGCEMWCGSGGDHGGGKQYRCGVMVVVEEKQ